jgi:CDP-diacylglycerol--glycerol-3-phosphate 3-phosphatidyltransferase
MNTSVWICRLCTSPNAITLIRPVGTGPFIWCCLHAQAHIAYCFAALLLFGLIAASDMLDGWMARRRHQESAFGRVLDHLCDVGFILAALGRFAWQGWVPWWLPAAIVWAFGLYATRSWWLMAGTTGPTLIGSRLGHLGGILNYGAVGLVALDLCTGRLLGAAGLTTFVFILLASLALLSGLDHLYALLILRHRVNP